MESGAGVAALCLVSCAALADCGGESRSSSGAAGRAGSAPGSGGNGALGGSGGSTGGGAGRDGTTGGQAPAAGGRSAAAGASGNPTTGGRPTMGGNGPTATGGAGPGEGGEPAVVPTGCTYDSRAHADEEEFLAVDGCNRCRCMNGVAECTAEKCEPECTVAPIGRLCVLGDWDGGPTASLEVGARLMLQVEPAGCISGFCNEPLIQTCDVAAQPGGRDFTATATFCTRFVDRMACSDCGSFTALCSGDPLGAGTHTVTLGDLSVTFEVPSVFPPLAYCTEFAP